MNDPNVSQSDSNNPSSSSQGDILVVDDTLPNLRTLSAMLTKQGYKVRGARNGSTALMIVEEKPPDLILLDIRMLGMDGYQVCRQLKARAKTRDIPVIFISALDEVTDKVKGFEVGGVDYITKPFQFEEVLARVETHLALHNLQKQLEAQNVQLQRQITERKRAEKGQKEALAEALQARHALEKAHDELEQRVEERTAELEAEIIERVRAEAALRESEKRWNSLTRNTNDIIQILDIEGNIRYMNKVYPPHKLKDIIGKSAFEFMDAESGKIARKLMEKLLEKKDPQTFKILILFPGHNSVPFEVKFVPMFANGKVDQIITLATDITERKQAEEALKESENRFRSLIEQCPLPTVIYNPDGRPTYFNRAHADVFYVNAETQEYLKENYNILEDEQVVEKGTMPFVERGFFEGPTKIPGIVWDPRETGVTKNIKHSVRNLEGTIFPVQTKSGKTTDVVFMLMDITERKQAEEKLRHLRNYLANIIDSMPSALVGVDPDGKVTLWNSEVQRTTGVSVEEAVGQSLERAFPRLAAEMERVRQAMQTGEVCSNTRLARKENAQTLYEDVTIYPLLANGVAGAVIRVDDVTERVRLEEMMVQNEKMLSVGGLAAGMAHEINNPLGGMMQTADVMSNRLTNLDLPANQRAAEEAGISLEDLRAFMEARDIPKMLGRIRESGNRAADIVANMLSFARQSDSTFSTHNLAKLLDQSADLAGSDYDLKKKFDFRQIKIVREYEADLPGMPCEAGKIQQVFLNILRNGAEAMQEAGIEKPKFILRTRFEKERKRVIIELKDNGPGMDEATRKRIFEPFFTTKPVGVGTGLGLSVSYFIITENHGGEINVESESGQGTTFIIRLPVERKKS